MLVGMGMLAAFGEHIGRYLFTSPLQMLQESEPIHCVRNVSGGRELYNYPQAPLLKISNS